MSSVAGERRVHDHRVVNRARGRHQEICAPHFAGHARALDGLGALAVELDAIDGAPGLGDGFGDRALPGRGLQDLQARAELGGGEQFADHGGRGRVPLVSLPRRGDPGGGQDPGERRGSITGEDVSADQPAVPLPAGGAQHPVDLGVQPGGQLVGQVQKVADSAGAGQDAAHGGGDGGAHWSGPGGRVPDEPPRASSHSRRAAQNWPASASVMGTQPVPSYFSHLSPLR